MSTITHMYVRNPICHECIGPGSKDHPALTTVFACIAGWSLKPGFTVLEVFTYGPSVNIDIYLETKTSRLGGRGLSACSFLEKYRCTVCMCGHVQKRKEKISILCIVRMCSFLREGG